MSQSEKAAYFRALKDAGVPFTKHYREYNTEELKLSYDAMVEAGQITPLAEQLEDPLPGMPEPPMDDQAEDVPDSSFFSLPQRAADPNERPGQRQNSKPEDEPIRVDEQGRLWFQEEIRKPASPRPRARRVLTYTETGVKNQVAKSGDYIESFEVAGDEIGRTAEVKITLPSYQVGIYKDPRFPFRVHTYNGLEGFDLFEVQDYFGGAELVPVEVKRKYVENVLCYDIRTTVRAIQDEYRQLQLAGKVD